MSLNSNYEYVHFSKRNNEQAQAVMNMSWAQQIDSLV